MAEIAVGRLVSGREGGEDAVEALAQGEGAGKDGGRRPGPAAGAPAERLQLGRRQALRLGREGEQIGVAFELFAATLRAVLHRVGEIQAESAGVELEDRAGGRFPALLHSSDHNR